MINKHLQRGATMVELLVVVAILSVLTSITIARVPRASAAEGGDISQVEQAALTACRYNLGITQNATEYFAVLNGRYPKSPAELYPLFLDRVPTCPAHGTPYTYDEYYIVQCTGHNR